MTESGLYLLATLWRNTDKYETSAPFVHQLPLMGRNADGAVVLTNKDGDYDSGLYLWYRDKWNFVLTQDLVSSAFRNSRSLTVYYAQLEDLEVQGTIYYNGKLIDGTTVGTKGVYAVLGSAAISKVNDVVPEADGTLTLTPEDLGSVNDDLIGVPDGIATLNEVGVLTNSEIPEDVARLDTGGKLFMDQIPASMLGATIYQGTWNAQTNTPTIPQASSGNKGHYYVVNVAGDTVIDGTSEWDLGDWIISNGTTWQQVDNQNRYPDPATPTELGIVKVPTTSGISVTSGALALNLQDASATPGDSSILSGTIGSLKSIRGSKNISLTDHAGAVEIQWTTTDLVSQTLDNTLTLEEDGLYVQRMVDAAGYDFEDGSELDYVPPAVFGTNSLAVGSDANSDDASTSVGSFATSGPNAVAVGAFSVSEESGVAIGHTGFSEQASVAIGPNSKALTDNGPSVAVGADTEADGAAVAVGYGAEAKAVNSVSVGFVSFVGAEELGKGGSVAVGYNARVEDSACGTAIGTQSQVNGTYGVAISGGRHVGTFGDSCVAICSTSIEITGDRAVAIMVAGGGPPGEDGVSIGSSTGIGTAAIGIGKGGYATAPGAIAIGDTASSHQLESVAIGARANVAGGANSVALGADSLNDSSDQVSFGNTTLKRRVSRVAEPTQTDDAATKGYVDSVLIPEAPQDGEIYARQNGEWVIITHLLNPAE